jgi:hypothetical protein
MLSEQNPILRDGKYHPNFYFMVNNIHMLLRLNKKNINLNLGIKDVQIHNYFIDSKLFAER